ncbi:MAG TPA: 50S ribosomal protein L4 [Clostridiales bacterium]|nr:50S ribosomal protein L4 [Clostridiales bacterium]
MAKVKVYDMAAKVVDEIELNDELFALEYNEPLIHEAVVAYQANQRQGNKSVLTRSEVRGHAKKPWRQKKTGRARHGSTKSPEYTGGGVVFAPKPRDFSKKMNKTAKRLALLTALSRKIALGQFIVLKDFEIASGKTKDANAFLKAFGLSGRTLVVGKDNSTETLRATANIKSLNAEDVRTLTTYEVVANKNVLLTADAVKTIEEAYAE